MDARMTRTTYMGLDVHKHFSRLTACDASGAIVFRGRLEHADREALRLELAHYPRKAFRQIDWFLRERLIKHLKRRS